jgi:hypothetical protein
MKACQSPIPRKLKKMLTLFLNLGSSPNDFFNLTLGTGEEELVLSTERFSGKLKSMDCNANSSIAMSFISNSTYKSAMAFWNWVHFSEERSFILITNFDGCSMDKARQPGIVSNVDYDPAQLMVHLNATQNFWPEIAQTFSLDFGKYMPSPQPGQKPSIIDVTQSFSINLNHPLPQALLPDTAMSDYLPDSFLASKLIATFAEVKAPSNSKATSSPTFSAGFQTSHSPSFYAPSQPSST